MPTFGSSAHADFTKERIRKIVKKPALLILLFTAVLVLDGCSVASVNRPKSSALATPRIDTPKVGDAEKSFEGAYGKPVLSTKEGFKDYADGLLIIEAHYSKGLAESVLYKTRTNRPLGDYWVSRILSLNSHSKAWVVKRDSKPNDIWYRTTDCRLIANLYKDRILSVSTRQFRQWLWDKAGKGKLPPEQSKISIFYPDCACVFLGQSESKMTDLLGNPSASINNANVRIYHDDDVTTRAQFENDKCVAIKYTTSKRKLSDHWVSATLALNSAGLAWITDESFGKGRRRFITINRQLHAVLKERGYELMIYTEKLNKKTQKRLDLKSNTKRDAVSKKLGLD